MAYSSIGFCSPSKRRPLKRIHSRARHSMFRKELTMCCSFSSAQDACPAAMRSFLRLEKRIQSENELKTFQLKLSKWKLKLTLKLVIDAVIHRCQIRTSGRPFSGEGKGPNPIAAKSFLRRRAMPSYSVSVTVFQSKIQLDVPCHQLQVVDDFVGSLAL